MANFLHVSSLRRSTLAVAGRGILLDAARRFAFPFFPAIFRSIHRQTRRPGYSDSLATDSSRWSVRDEVAKLAAAEAKWGS